MQAVVLAGGLGTRLRPITYTRPKPLIPIVNRPLILRVLDILPLEVEEVFIATGYKGNSLRDFFSVRRCAPRVEVVVEDKPLGTGGALKNIEGKIRGTFIVVNGDVICSLDVAGMAALHRRRKATGTVSLWEMEDPTPFGMVVTDDSGCILEFREKPRREEVISHAVNAGIYILEPEIFDMITPGREVSIEKEVFPRLVGRGLYGHRFTGYWYDAGTLESYLRIHFDLMNREGGHSRGSGLEASRSTDWHPPFATGKGCRVGDGSIIGPGACLGEDVSIGKDCIVENCVLHDGVNVGNGSILKECIIGEGACIIAGTNVPPGTIIGDGKEVR